AGLHISIIKRIPSQAGLGGGSSNAAAVFKALRHLLQLPVGDDEFSSLAAQVGSDVPFFLAGGTARAKGRGEEIVLLPDIRPRSLLLVKPPFGVSTPWAYHKLDEMKADLPEKTSGTITDRLCVCIESEHCEKLPGLLGNDLELPAFEEYPQIAEIKEGLLRAGAEGALMSGSGSAVFGLFRDEDEATRVAKDFAQAGSTFTARTIGRSETGYSSS
ncbi:MAG TPA: 4-(cytidine 5'-diphospho)-2-C-methyl-D-erythritol kinase, partial [Armatimonadota bacterium]